MHSKSKSQQLKKTDLCVNLVDVCHPPAEDVGCDVNPILVPEVGGLAPGALDLGPGVAYHSSHHTPDLICKG